MSRNSVTRQAGSKGRYIDVLVGDIVIAAAEGGTVHLVRATDLRVTAERAPGDVHALEAPPPSERVALDLIARVAHEGATKLLGGRRH
jgi:uncharacterized protein YjlB